MIVLPGSDKPQPGGNNAVEELCLLVSLRLELSDDGFSHSTLALRVWTLLAGYTRVINDLF